MKALKFYYNSQLIGHRCLILLSRTVKLRMRDKVQGSLLEDEVDVGAIMCGNIAGRVVDTYDVECILDILTGF